MEGSLFRVQKAMQYQGKTDLWEALQRKMDQSFES